MWGTRGNCGSSTRSWHGSLHQAPGLAWLGVAICQLGARGVRIPGAEPFSVLPGAYPREELSKKKPATDRDERQRAGSREALSWRPGLGKLDPWPAAFWLLPLDMESKNTRGTPFLDSMFIWEVATCRVPFAKGGFSLPSCSSPRLNGLQLASRET